LADKILIMVTCWICSSQNVIQLSQKSVLDNLTPNDLKISDFQYGVSLARFRCSDCSFVFCPTATDTLDAYSEMIDLDYAFDSDLRILRAREIVKRVVRFKSDGSWLDVGAGSGELVEASSDSGFKSMGLEPSQYLSKIAVELGRDVLRESLLTYDFGDLDVVSFIDVIEHVENPRELLSKAKSLLTPDGVLVIITPDINSLAARVFKNFWWHIRPAHIGYFSRATLCQLLKELNLQVLSISRPPRTFHGKYLATRLTEYLPAPISGVLKSIFSDSVIRLNLYDEIMVVAAFPRIRMVE